MTLTEPKTIALVRFLKIQENEEYYKEIRVGKSTFKRYSSKALDTLKRGLKAVNMEEVWATCRPGCN
jgi:hypothetical protein